MISGVCEVWQRGEVQIEQLHLVGLGQFGQSIA